MRINKYQKPTPTTKAELEDWEHAYLQSVGWASKAIDQLIADATVDDVGLAAQAQLATQGARQFKDGWDAHERWCEVNEASFDRGVGWFVADREERG